MGPVLGPTPFGTQRTDASKNRKSTRGVEKGKLLEVYAAKGLGGVEPLIAFEGLKGLLGPSEALEVLKEPYKALKGLIRHSL